jgi:hypothetical protein
VNTCCNFPAQASLTVKGVLSYTAGEAGEEGAVAKGDDPKPIAADEMSVLHLGNWVHSAKEILPQGRCTFMAWPPAPEGEEEDESAPKAPKYVEVNAQPLRSVHLDSSQGRQLWNASTGSSSKPAVAMVRSNVWPGAVAAYNGKRVVNVYVGFGMKSGLTSGVSPVTPAIEVLSLCRHSLVISFIFSLKMLQMAPTASDFTEQDELNEKPAAPVEEAPAADE